MKAMQALCGPSGYARAGIQCHTLNVTVAGHGDTDIAETIPFATRPSRVGVKILWVRALPLITPTGLGHYLFLSARRLYPTRQACSTLHRRVVNRIPRRRYILSRQPLSKNRYIAKWPKELEVDSDVDEVRPEDDEVPDEVERRTRRRNGALRPSMLRVDNV
jgi:hypothetical protein